MADWPAGHMPLAVNPARLRRERTSTTTAAKRPRHDVIRVLQERRASGAIQETAVLLTTQNANVSELRPMAAPPSMLGKENWMR